MRHIVQFPEEIACILTEQEQQLYQRVRGIYSHIKRNIVVVHYLLMCMWSHRCEAQTSVFEWCWTFCCSLTLKMTKFLDGNEYCDTAQD